MSIEEDELKLIKQRADVMGIKYHPNIGLKRLKAIVNDKIKPLPEPSVDTENERPHQKKKRLRDEANKLVRIRVTNMNPRTGEKTGEYFSVGNSVVGNFTKYVQFNTDDGWHVPNIIYKHLKERKCQVFFTGKGRDGRKERKGKLIAEFAIELMDSLTAKELAELAQRQLMARGDEVIL